MKEYEIHSSANYMTEGGTEEGDYYISYRRANSAAEAEGWYAKHSKNAAATTLRWTASKRKEDKAMTEKQIQQIKDQLPAGEYLDRMYSAFEGGIRVISRGWNGAEFRYRVSFDADDNASIERM